MNINPIMLAAVLTLATAPFVAAQTAPSSVATTSDTIALKAYTGVYAFEADAPVKQTTVQLKGGKLVAISEGDEMELLPQKEADTFQVMNAGADGTVMATFIRGADRRVNKIRVNIDGMAPFEGKLVL